MTILNQINTLKASKLAAFIGLIIGGFVPVATFTIAHAFAPSNRILWVIVAGGLTYSALTVYEWSIAVGNHPVKALGFVILLESTLTFVQTGWLSYSALAILMLVNGCAVACQLVVARNAEIEAAQRVAADAEAAKVAAAKAERKAKRDAKPKVERKPKARKTVKAETAE